MNQIRQIFWLAARFLLSLRYRVDVRGQEKLQDLSGATLVLPNHPGYIDPALVLSHVKLESPLRPLVFSGTYRMKMLHPIMRFVRALEVPNVQSHSATAKDQATRVIDAAAAHLDQGENILMYPSGRTQREDREVIGGARATHELLNRCPDINVVLIRTSGIWGSSFTRACTGQQPDLAGGTLRGLFWTLLSGLFFMPRRPVTMEIEVVTPARFSGMSKVAVNRWLEDWYNHDNVLPPLFVRYHHLLGPSTRDFHTPNPLTGEASLAGFDDDLRHAVNEIVGDHTVESDIDMESVSPATTLDSLGIDSLERMSISLAVEERFGFRSDEVPTTLQELYQLASGQLTKTAGLPASAPADWKGPVDSESAKVLDDTLPKAFVRRCLAEGNRAAVADGMSGVLSYRKLLVAALALRNRFAKLEGRAVGLVLPASGGADTAFFGLQLAGKLPVLLNWTTGPAAMRHAIESLGIKHVVTSRRFVDRLALDIEGVQLEFLEDMKASMTRFELLRLLLATYLASSQILRSVPSMDAGDDAVILFTSGSENHPKAVPLSHQNLLSNIEAGQDALQLSTSDSMLGFLPPFHSFGLTGNVLLPLLTGIRVVHHPDPTDASGLTRTVATYRPTLLFSTPTFLSYMLAADEHGALPCLRMVATGAEKCPERLLTDCRERMPETIVLEGYGITECSPLVAVNRPGASRDGTIGKPLHNVETLIIGPDDRQPITDPNPTGLLLVRGPSVFRGYENFDGGSPMVNVAGKTWYNTGDLVQIDGDGFIHFRGRLKRFIKSGGEMISLPALELPLTNRYAPDENGPRVAVEGIEIEQGRRIVLFATFPITLKQANDELVQAGFRGIMRIDEVRQVAAIPVLGTGKTDYKTLKAELHQLAPSTTP